MKSKYVLALFLLTFLIALEVKPNAKYIQQKQSDLIKVESNYEVEQCANALKSVIVAINSLGEDDYCSLLLIINNNLLSESQKSDTIRGNVAFLNLVSEFEKSNLILLQNNFSLHINNSELRSEIWNRLETTIFGSRVNKPNCDAYNEAATAIGAAYFVCVLQTGLFTWGSVGCGVAALYALKANDAAYPECANGRNRPIILSPWLYTNAESFCGNKYYDK